MYFQKSWHCWIFQGLKRPTLAAFTVAGGDILQSQYTFLAPVCSPGLTALWIIECRASVEYPNIVYLVSKIQRGAPRFSACSFMMKDLRYSNLRYCRGSVSTCLHCWAPKISPWLQVSKLFIEITLLSLWHISWWDIIVFTTSCSTKSN